MTDFDAYIDRRAHAQTLRARAARARLRAPELARYLELEADAEEQRADAADEAARMVDSQPVASTYTRGLDTFDAVAIAVALLAATGLAVLLIGG